MTLPEYPLEVVSVIEAILENPRPVLAAQLFKASGEAVAEMKAEGIEYDARLELLDSVTYPQPLAELLEAAYAIYVRGHPWVADYELKPKSVARDMYERAMTFTEYIGWCGLARSEGLLLRYLADVYKTLRQTVPDDAKTEELIDLIEWLGEMVRQVDSSLLDEWERLANPDAADGGPGGQSQLDERPPASDRQRAGVSACWCATRCSAGLSFRGAAPLVRMSSASLTERLDWDAGRLGECA